MHNPKVFQSPVSKAIPFDNSTNDFNATESQTAIEEAVFAVKNVVYVNKQHYPGHFSTIAAALASITDVSTTNPYTILVGPGVYTENPFSLQPGLSIVGLGDRQSTILQPSDLTNHFITVVENSFLRNMTVYGPTTVDKASIFMSSSTATDTNPCWIQRIVFGAADTLMLVSAVNNDNTLSMSDCRVGIGPFNNGFKATTTGSGKGRILGFQISCGDLVSPLPNYIGYVSGVGCVLNFSLGRYRSSTVTSGACFKADNGGQLKLLGLSISGFGKGVHLPNVGSAPAFDAIGCTFQKNGNTVDVQIDHTAATGDISSCIITLSKLINNSPNTMLFGYQDPITGDMNCNRISATRGFATDLTNLTTFAGTHQLVSFDAHTVVITGSTSGTIIQLPDATTLRNGHQFWILNTSSVTITTQQYGGSNPFIVTQSTTVRYVLRDNSTSAGIWAKETTSTTAPNGVTPPFIFSKSGGAGVGAYLKTGEVLTSNTGQLIKGSNFIVEINCSSSANVSGTNGAIIQLQRRTGLTTFVDISGATVTVPSGSFSGQSSGLLIPIGADWEISCYNSGPENLTNPVVTMFIIPQ